MRQLPLTRTAARRTLLALALALVPATVIAPPANADSPARPQPYLETMKAEQMWKVSQGEGVKIALIDSDVDRALPELKGRVLPEKQFGADLEQKPDGHGTSMAALIAGSGAKGGIQGLAPKVTLLPLDLSDTGPAEGGENLPKAIDHAVKSGAKIISMSGGHADRGLLGKGTQAAIHRAQRAGVLFFAGAGNNGDTTNDKLYPAALPGVIAVAATDKNGKRAEWSSRGPHVALAAHGTDATMIDENGKYFAGQGGTSTATALTSASAALIWAKHPDWTGNQVLRTPIQSAHRPDAEPDAKPDSDVGHGTVRPHKVLLEGEGEPGDPDTHPTFARYYADLDAKAADDDGDNNATLLLAGGLTSAVLLSAAVLYARHRRRTTRTD